MQTCNPTYTGSAARPGAFFATRIATTLLALLLAGCASLPADVPRPVSNALATPDATALGQLVQARRAAAGTRQDSAFQLLDSVDLALNARYKLSLSATDGSRSSPPNTHSRSGSPPSSQATRGDSAIPHDATANAAASTEYAAGVQASGRTDTSSANARGPITR